MSILEELIRQEIELRKRLDELTRDLKEIKTASNLLSLTDERGNQGSFPAMNFSPSEKAQILELAARMLTDELRANINLDELNTLELSTAAQLMGLTVTHAARVLPVIQVGPRTRRVTVAAYKAFLAKNTNPPTR